MAGKWLAGGWKYRQKITLDHTKFGETVTHFPLMLRISGSCGASAQDLTAVFDEVGANSLKIAVTKEDGDTQLYVEVEKWDSVGEEAILWISKSDWNISHLSDTVIYLYYDQHHADNTTYVGVVGSAPGQAVWDSYFKAVYHMPDNPDTGHIKDSTSNANNGTKKGTNEPIEADGKVGKGQQFDGSDDYISVPYNSSLNITDEITYEFIIYPTVAGATDARMFVRSNQVSNVYRPSGGGVQCELRIDSAWRNANGWDTAPINEYHHFALSYKNTDKTVRQFKDGVNNLSRLLSGLSTYDITSDSSSVLYIGAWSSSSMRFPGIMDEVRLSRKQRSAYWIASTKAALWDEINTFTLENLHTPARWGYATWG